MTQSTELNGKGLLINLLKNEAHMKWLSKAETAVINGSEMTVLPYGYLSQAVGEAVEKALNTNPKEKQNDQE